MFILIVFQMFLFNTFILYLRQNIKNELVCRKPYYSTTYICEATTPSISRVRTLNYIVLQKGEVHCTVINLSVMCLSLVVLSVSQANNSLQHDISKRLSLQIKYCRNSEKPFVCSKIFIVDDVCVFCGFFLVFLFFCYCCAN
jgi:hypothetical protein